MPQIIDRHAGPAVDPVLEAGESEPVVLGDEAVLVPERRRRRFDLAEPGFVDAQAGEELQEPPGLAVPDHVPRKDGRYADVEAWGGQKDVDGPQRLPEGPPITAAGVVDLFFGAVEADGYGEQAGLAKLPGPIGRDAGSRREQLDGAAFGAGLDDPDEVLLEERLAPCQAEPENPRLPEAADHVEDGRRVKGLTGPVAVIAEGAALRTGVGHGHLGVRRPLDPSTQVVADEPAVGRAVERREMGMDDDVPADVADPELPHVAEEEHGGARTHPQGPGLAEDGLENFPAESGPARLHRPRSPFTALAARTAKVARKTRPNTIQASAARKSVA